MHSAGRQARELIDDDDDDDEGNTDDETAAAAATETVVVVVVTSTVDKDDSGAVGDDKGDTFASLLKSNALRTAGWSAPCAVAAVVVIAPCMACVGVRPRPCTGLSGRCVKDSLR